MKTVLIIKSWKHPDIFRQSKNRKGIWKEIKFTEDLNSQYDYVLVLGQLKYDTKVYTFRRNIWSVQQEPPNEYFKYYHSANSVYSRVYTTDTDLKGDRYVQSQPAIPWFVDKTYEELKSCPIPKKKYNLSWITSLKTNFIGHKKRMDFFNKVKTRLPVDLIATSDYYQRQEKAESSDTFKSELFKNGFTKVVANKWNGLSPYKYSLIIENFQCPFYWSEKLADCYLSFTFPIYYGCLNISDYFPKQSLVQIDIDDPMVFDKIRDVYESNLWEKNIHNIMEARELILEKYQFFPYFSDQIRKWEILTGGIKMEKESIVIPKENILVTRIISELRKFFTLI